MRDPHEKAWTKPRITQFRDVEAVWEHYQSKSTAEERTQIGALLDVMRLSELKASAERRRRRA